MGKARPNHGGFNKPCYEIGMPQCPLYPIKPPAPRVLSSSIYQVVAFEGLAHYALRSSRAVHAVTMLLTCNETEIKIEKHILRSLLNSNWFSFVLRMMWEGGWE